MAQKVDVHSKSMKRKKGPDNHTNICQDLPAVFVTKSTQPAVVVDQVMPPVETGSGDVDLQEDSTNENCTQKQSASSPNTRRRMKTMESFTVVASKSVANTSERSSDSTSTETECGDAAMKEVLRSESCGSQEQSDSILRDRGREQAMDMVAISTPEGPTMNSTSG